MTGVASGQAGAHLVTAGAPADNCEAREASDSFAKCVVQARQARKGGREGGRRPLNLMHATEVSMTEPEVQRRWTGRMRKNW